MSELVEKLIGSHVECAPSIHPLARLVEQRLQVDKSVKRFLASLPENPPIERLRVLSVNEHAARCSCSVKIKDHESASFFQTETLFDVDLATSRCASLRALQ